MKTTDPSDLLLAVWELSELHKSIKMMIEDEETSDYINIQVKGKGEDPVLLPTLKRCHKIIDGIDIKGDLFEPIHDEFNECVEYLDKNYSIKSKILKRPENLRKKDFEMMSDNLYRILSTLINYSDNFAIIPLKNKEKKSRKIIGGLDKKTRGDYNEALQCLDFGLTTASFMLLCRVAEKMATTYYEKFMQKKPNSKNWNKKYEEIEKIYKEKNIRPPILALFDFLRTKRNKAQHPGERFDDEECQKILHYLDDFHKEISKYAAA